MNQTYTGRKFTLTARWKKNYTLHYDYGSIVSVDGTRSDAKTEPTAAKNDLTFKYNYESTSNNFSSDNSDGVWEYSPSSNPTWDGYVFVGWSKTKGGDYTTGKITFNVSDFAAPDTSSANSADHDSYHTTLYANWTKKVTVTYNGNQNKINSETGAIEDGVSSTTYNSGTAVTMNNGQISHYYNQYNFINWNTERDGSGTDYEKNSKPVLSGDLTVYAQWSTVYNLLYKKNCDDQNISVPSNGSLLLRNPVSSKHSQYKDAFDLDDGSSMSRPGYHFLGWSLSPEAGSETITKIPVSEFTPDETTNSGKYTATVYAQWTDKAYTYSITSDQEVDSKTSIVGLTDSPQEIIYSALVTDNGYTVTLPTCEGYKLSKLTFYGKVGENDRGKELPSTTNANILSKPTYKLAKTWFTSYEHVTVVCEWKKLYRLKYTYTLPVYESADNTTITNKLDGTNNPREFDEDSLSDGKITLSTSAPKCQQTNIYDMNEAESYVWQGWSQTNHDDLTSVITQLPESAFDALQDGRFTATVYPVWKTRCFMTAYGNGGWQPTVNKETYKYYMYGDQNYTTYTGFPFSSSLFRRTGYEFLGWNTAADGSGTYYLTNDQATSEEHLAKLKHSNIVNYQAEPKPVWEGRDNVFYAQWRWQGQYAVKYDYNLYDLTNGPNPVTSTVGRMLTVNPITTGESTFAGGKEWTLSTWNPELKEDAYGQTGLRTWLWKGWSLSPDNDKDKIITSLPQSAFTEIVDDKLTVTVYPVWEQRAVVTFHGNGGQTSGGSNLDYRFPTSIYDVDITGFPSLPGYRWADHAFIGWNTQADGLGTWYFYKSQVENQSLADYINEEYGNFDNLVDYQTNPPTFSGTDNHLYAMWNESQNYAIEYDYNRPAEAPDAKIWRTIHHVTITPDNYDEYHIATRDGGTLYFNSTTNKWALSTWTPYLYQNLYSITEDDTTEPGERKDVQTYIFKGWSLSPDQDQSKIITELTKAQFDEEVISENKDGYKTIKVYAVWAPRAAVYFHPNPPTGVESTLKDLYCVPGNIYTTYINNFPGGPWYSYLGHNLIGWNTEPDGTGTYYLSNAQASNATHLQKLRNDRNQPIVNYNTAAKPLFPEDSGVTHLYAQWERKYQITFYRNDPTLDEDHQRISSDYDRLHSVNYNPTVDGEEYTPYLSVGTAPEYTKRWMETNKNYVYFKGWSWTQNPTDDSELIDDKVILNDLKPDGDTVHFTPVSAVNNGYYHATLYGVWSNVPYKLVYKDGGRQGDDITKPKSANITFPSGYPSTVEGDATTREIELDYTDVMSNYSLPDEYPSATEGYSFNTSSGWYRSYTNKKSGNVVQGGMGMGNRTVSFYTFRNSADSTVTVTAQWKPNTHKITYYKESYNSVTGDPVYEDDGVTVKLTRITDIASVPYETGVTVGYNLSGGAIYHKETIKNRVFGGWKLISDSAVYDADDPQKDISLLEWEDTFKMPDQDLAFVAVYTPEYCTVTYQPGEGTAANGNVVDTVKYGFSHTVRDVATCGFEAPEGYKFQGWSVAPATNPDGRAYTTTKGNTISNLREDLVYTAIWTEDDFTVFYEVSYQTEGGKPSDISYTAVENREPGQKQYASKRDYTYKSSVAIQDVPSSYSDDSDKAGKVYDSRKYVFDGWTLADNSQKKNGSDGTAIPNSGTFLMPAGSVTFKGVFRDKSYTVTYLPGDHGSGSTVTQSVVYNHSATVKTFEQCSFTPESGYEFDGWSVTGASATTPGQSFTVTGDVTFTATYKLRDFTVRYRIKAKDTNPPAAMYSIPQDSNSYHVGQGNVPVADVLDGVVGYDFIGWRIAEPAGVADVVTDAHTGSVTSFTMPSSDVVLEGEFAPIEYQVKYHRNLTKTDGTLDDTIVATKTFTVRELNAQGNYDYDKTVSPGSFDGFSFLGWSNQPDGTINAPVAFNANQEDGTFHVYARWNGWIWSVVYQGGSGHDSAAPMPEEQHPAFADVVNNRALINSTDIPLQDGYDFLGWDVVNGTASDFFAEGESRFIARTYFAESETSGVATAVARWNKLYRLHFDLNGAPGSIADKQFDLAESAAAWNFNEVPTWDEYHTFLGWKMADETAVSGSQASGYTVYTDKFTTLAEGTDGSKRFEATVVAVWRNPGEFEVKYTIQGTSPRQYTGLPAPFTMEHGQKFAVEDRPVITGYDFDGWTYDGHSYPQSPNVFTMPNDDVTFVGKFTANSYNVEYYQDNGTDRLIDPISFDYDATVTVGTDGSGNAISTDRDGYRFLGWELMDDDSAVKDADGADIPSAAGSTFRMPAGTVKFKATYERLYKLVYHSEDGTEHLPDPVKFEVQQEESVSKALVYNPAPTRDGYTFQHWSTTPNGAKVTQMTAAYDSDYATIVTESGEKRFVIDVYAVWKEIVPYTVKYELDSTGAMPRKYIGLPGSFTKVPGETFAVEKIPVVIGYDFEGWKYNGQSYPQTPNVFTMPESNVTFVGKFTVKSYTVEYYRENGTDRMIDPVSFDYDATVTVGTDGSGNAISTDRDGYRFLGWELMDDDSAVKDADGADIPTAAGSTFSMPTGTVKFKATYERLYKLVYHSEDGTEHLPDPVKFEVQQNESAEKALIYEPAPTRDGYTFQHWSTTPNGAKVTQITAAYDSDYATIVTENGEKRFVIDVYAVWQQNAEDKDVTLRYDANGGRNQDGGDVEAVLPAPETAKNALHTTVKAPQPELVRDGYTFTGWKDGDGADYPISDTVVTFTKDTVLYAQWEKLPVYHVTYRVTGTDPGADQYVLPEDNEAYWPGKEVTVKSQLAVDGYTFVGWSYNGKDDYKQGDTFPMPSGDVTLLGWFVKDGEVGEQYEIVYESGVRQGDKGWTQALLQSHTFQPENNRHTVLAYDSDELKYTRAGYTFLGWKQTLRRGSSSGGRSGAGSGQNDGLLHENDVIDVNSSMTLTAQWAELYTLTYDANGGSGEVPVDNNGYMGGERITVAGKSNLSKNGCTFKEWNTKPDGSGDGFAPNEGVYTMPKRNATLYAIWVNADGKVVLSPGTGESALGIQLAFNAAVISLLAAGSVMMVYGRRRRRTV